MIEYIGYHGTNKPRFEIIEKNGFKLERPKGFLPCDLGPGIYTFIQRPEFKWECPKENARKYVDHIKPNYEEPIVLEIASSYEKEEHILDMNDSENQAVFLKFKEFNLERIKRIFSGLKKDGTKLRGKNDGLILNLMILESGQKIDAIMIDSYTPFDFDGYHQSNIPNGRELCIRNTKSIKYFKVCWLLW